MQILPFMEHCKHWNLSNRVIYIEAHKLGTEQAQIGRGKVKPFDLTESLKELLGCFRGVLLHWDESVLNKTIFLGEN